MGWDKSLKRKMVKKKRKEIKWEAYQNYNNNNYSIIKNTLVA
jgi:hypothetical protein